MAAASYSTIVRQVISLLNAQVATTAYPVSDTDIGTTKRNSGELKEAVVEADLEARLAICETPGNGFRNSFIAVSALTPLAGNAQSAKLPERIGPVSRVEIKIASADTTWIAGEWCPLNEITEIIANPDNVFQTTQHATAGSGIGGYFFIDENADLITWTGDSVRVYTASIGTIDRATPTLLTPDTYSPFLVARSMASVCKHGDQQQFMEYWDRRSNQLLALIRQGAMVLPNVEPMVRAA